MTHTNRSPGHLGRTLVRLVLVGMFVALAPAAAAATPATGQVAQATAATYQPDGRIREPCHREFTDCIPAWYGNNVYNLTASGQTAEWSDCCGLEEPPVVFRIRIQNDGTRTDRFRVVATGKTAGYRVRFFRGTTDITAAVKAGTYRTPWLASGESFRIRARVTLNEPSGGDNTYRLVTLTSVSNRNKQDTVKFVRNYVVCGC